MRAPLNTSPLLLNREKTMTEHPAPAALNPPERQLAAAFLQWLATIEDTRTQTYSAVARVSRS
ncbi:MAG: hypothetical protein ACRDQX_05825, partial [Pseudonocardiaceae bacterium]